MNDISEHPVYSKSVLEFITVANDFSMTMSRIESLKITWLTNYLQKILPLLYIKGSLLPSIEVTNPEANERFFTEEEWEFLFNQFRLKFAGDNEFWFIDPSTSYNDPVKASLAESLTDICQDLKDFLTLYQKNSLDAKENAVNEVRISFEKRWGFLLVNVHKVLHYLIMNSRQQDEREFDHELY
jgi:hypothetical protein